MISQQLFSEIRQCLTLRLGASPRTRFVEPCAGDGVLVGHLTAAGHICVGGQANALGADRARGRGARRRAGRQHGAAEACGFFSHREGDSAVGWGPSM